MSHPQDRQQRPEEEEQAAQPPAMAVGEQRRRHRRHHRATAGANDADGAESDSNAGANRGNRPHHHYTRQQPHAARPRQARARAQAGAMPDGSDDNGTDPNEDGGKEEVWVASAKGDSDSDWEPPSSSTSASRRAASTSSRDPSRQDAGEDRVEGAARSIRGPPSRRRKQEDYSTGHRPSTGGRCDDNDDNDDAEGNHEDDSSPPGGKNCGRCTSCLDMVKFGGPGRLHQMCVVRKQRMLREQPEGGKRKRLEEQERDLIAKAARLGSSPLETDCGTCKSCLDKVEFGGTDTLKRPCLTRRRMQYKNKIADETVAARKTKGDGMDEAEGAVAGGAKSVTCRNGLDKVEFGGTGTLKPECNTRRRMRDRKKKAEETAAARWEEEERELIATATRLGRSPLETNCGICKNCLDKVEFGGTGTVKRPCLTRRRMWYKKKPADETAAARKTKDDGEDEAKGAVEDEPTAPAFGRSMTPDAIRAQKYRRAKKREADAVASTEKDDPTVSAFGLSMTPDAIRAREYRRAKKRVAGAVASAEKDESTASAYGLSMTPDAIRKRRKRREQAAAASAEKHEPAAASASGPSMTPGAIRAREYRRAFKRGAGAIASAEGHEPAASASGLSMTPGAIRERKRRRAKKREEAAAASAEENEPAASASGPSMTTGAVRARKLRSAKKREDADEAAGATLEEQERDLIAKAARLGRSALETNCGTCKNCLDKLEFGGTGKLQLGCLTRRRLRDKKKRADEAAAASKTKKTNMVSLKEKGDIQVDREVLLPLHLKGGEDAKEEESRTIPIKNCVSPEMEMVAPKWDGGTDGDADVDAALPPLLSTAGEDAEKKTGQAITAEKDETTETGIITRRRMRDRKKKADEAAAASKTKKTNMVSLKEQGGIKVDREVLSPLHLEGGENAKEEESRTIPIKNCVSPEMEMVAPKWDGGTDGDADVDAALPPLLSTAGEDAEKKTGQAITTEKDETTETGMVAPKDARGAKGDAHVEAALPPFRSCSQENADKRGSQQVTRSYYGLLSPQGSPFMTRLLTVGALLVIAFLFRRFMFF